MALYTDTRRHYQLRYPDDWQAREEPPGRLTLAAPGGLAKLSIDLLAQDCAAVEAQVRAQATLNVYPVGNPSKRVAGREVAAHASYDTIAGARELRLLLPAPAATGCYDFRWYQEERPGAPDFTETLDSILASFIFLAQ